MAALIFFTAIHYDGFFFTTGAGEGIIKMYSYVCS